MDTAAYMFRGGRYMYTVFMCHLAIEKALKVERFRVRLFYSARLPRLGFGFERQKNRAAIVRHRLFSNAESHARKAASNLIQSYLNTWRRMSVIKQLSLSARRLSAMEMLTPSLILGPKESAL